jgi:hypothetical protein
MKKILGAVVLALLAQTACAQLAAEGLVIGVKRDEALAHIDRLARGGARIVCSRDSADRLWDNCNSSDVKGLSIEGHAVSKLRMEFFVKRLALLEVTFADRDTKPARTALLARVSQKLGKPTECEKRNSWCEWKRNGQTLFVPYMKPGNLTLVMMELKFDNPRIWGYENQEFDEIYPVEEFRTNRHPLDLAHR